MTTDSFPRPFSCNEKPDIIYPCPWTYKVIGTSEDALKKAIATVITGKEVLVSFSHTSSGGKYCSVNVEVVLEDDETRLRYYQNLKNHAAVKVVM